MDHVSPLVTILSVDHPPVLLVVDTKPLLAGGVNHLSHLFRQAAFTHRSGNVLSSAADTLVGPHEKLGDPDSPPHIPWMVDANANGDQDDLHITRSPGTNQPASICIKQGATEQRFTVGFTGSPALNPPTWTADDES